MLDKSHIGKWFTLKLDKIDQYNRELILDKVDQQYPYAKLIGIKYPNTEYVINDGFDYMISFRGNSGRYWTIWAYEEWLEEVFIEDDFIGMGL